MEVMEKRVGVHALQSTNTTFRTGNKYVKVSHCLAIILGYKPMENLVQTLDTHKNETE
jgi:hypothetical protein